MDEQALHGRLVAAEQVRETFAARRVDPDVGR